MIGPESLQFEIGSGDWVKEVQSFTDQFDPEFWDEFSLCSEDEIEACERQINRKFPDDYREFLLRIGAGRYSIGGGIYTLEDIVLACPGPFYTLLGSSEWATNEEQRRFYISRGAYNPRPELFTDEALTIDGVNLFDLLQVGSDGQCCYHLLNLAPSPRPFGYSLLDCSCQTLENRLPSFTDYLKHLLTQAWVWAMGLEEEQEEGLMDLSDIIIIPADQYYAEQRSHPLFDPDDSSDNANPFGKNRFGENRKRFSPEDENDQTE
jgi:hypothetical protein